MIKPDSLNDGLAKWVLLLSSYDIYFVPQKSMKGHAIADFLAKHPILKSFKLHEDIPDDSAEVNTVPKEQPW